MAYRTFFYMVDDSKLTGGIRKRDLNSLGVIVGSCSHYLSGHPGMRQFLDGGSKLEGLTHPSFQPNYRISSEIPGILIGLNSLLRNDFSGDEWSTSEINGFVKACEAAIEHGKGIASIVDGRVNDS